MNKLDNLINDWIFDAQEKRDFSTSSKDLSFLKKFLKEDGVKIKLVDNKTYFYCTMTKGEIEVCADSRAIVRPRTLAEAICVAAIKLYMPDYKKSWDKLLLALAVDLVKNNKQL